MKQGLVEFVFVAAFFALVAAGAVAIFGDELRLALGVGSPAPRARAAGPAAPAAPRPAPAPGAP